MPMTVDGLDGLLFDLETLAELPDDTLSGMLHAGGEVIAQAHKSAIQSDGLVDSGQLRDSIKVSAKVRRTSSARSVEIYPQGTRADGTRNAEVGFIHEYGAPGRGIPAKQWMRKANEQAEDAACTAAEEVYDDYLRSKNLL